jgi:hypothetical protein
MFKNKSQLSILFLLAVQCERKPLTIPPSSTCSHTTTDDRDRGYISSETGPEISLSTCKTPLYSSTPMNITNTMDHPDIVGRQHAEFKLRIPSLAIPKLSMDYIYEFATRLLFQSVDWTRSISAFRSLSKSDQVILLQRSWSEIFLLGVAQCINSFPFSPLLAFAASDLKTKVEGQNQKPPTSPVGQQSKFEKIMIIKDFVFSFDKLELDGMEYAYIKAIVLFNSGTF